jgi:hypothetical protein
MIVKILTGLLIVCVSLVILCVVYIAKWCDKEIDLIMKEELKKKIDLIMKEELKKRQSIKY